MPTVAGTLKNKENVALQNTYVVFKCTDGATVSGTDVTVAVQARDKTDASGDFSLTLVGGNYQVWIGDELQTTIAVPVSGGPYNFEDLVAAAAVSPNVLSGLTFQTPDGSYFRMTVTDLGTTRLTPI